MAQSPSLSFGPAWMHPKPKVSQSPQSQPSQAAILSPISRTYTVDELLKIWSLVNINVSKSGYNFTDRYKSLESIKNLVEQVEIDRQIQAQAQASQQQGQKINQYQHQHSQQSLLNGKEQLNDKLNDIATNWSAEEQSALDIAGILKNVAAQSHPSELINNSSPALQSSNIQQSASSASLLQSQFLPSHLQQQPTLIQPSELEWQYLDPNGNQQGPFSGLNMQQWFISGYLKDDLQLRRVGESVFYPLYQLKTSFGTTDPLSLSLPPVGYQQQQQQQQQPSLSSHSSFQFLNSGYPSNTLSNVFDGGLYQPTPSYDQSQQLFGNIGQVRASSPWTSTPQVPTQASLLQQNSGASGSPFLSGINLHESTAASAHLDLNSGLGGNAGYDFGNEGPDDLLNRIQSVVLGDVLGESNGVVHDDQKVPSQEEEVVQIPQQQEIVTQEPEVIPEVKEKVQEPVKQEKKPVSAPTSTTAKATKAQASPVKSVSNGTPKVAKSQQTPIAPWASITQNTNAQTSTEPRLTMSQLLELEKIEAKKQIKEEQKKSLQGRVVSEEPLKNVSTTPIKAKKQPQQQPAVEIPLTWASNNTPATPVKSILEIRKEEEELAKLKIKEEQEREAKEMAAAIAIVEANERKKAVEEDVFSGANGNAWTTVVAKKPVKPVSSKPKITSTNNRTNPDLLRKVSAPPVTATSSSLKTTPVKPTVSKINTRYEFLNWCKATLRLNPNVNFDEVLSVLLILPTGSNESKEIIADTIYCNSSTMDGRRFANEFMKRREAVEDVVHGDGLQWDDVLVSFNRNDGQLEDTGDFQVVRKGKRRN